MSELDLVLSDASLSIWRFVIRYGTSTEFWVQTFILITGVIGQLLVAKKDIRAFYSWSISNVFIIISTLPKEQYGMVLFYFFSIGFNIYSIMKWRKDHEREQVNQARDDARQGIGVTSANY